MSAFNFESLSWHVGHELECVTYGNEDVGIVNVAIECITCGEVLLDYDRVEVEGED